MKICECTKQMVSTTQRGAAVLCALLIKVTQCVGRILFGLALGAGAAFGTLALLPEAPLAIPIALGALTMLGGVAALLLLEKSIVCSFKEEAIQAVKSEPASLPPLNPGTTSVQTSPQAPQSTPAPQSNPLLNRLTSGLQRITTPVNNTPKSLPKTPFIPAIPPTPQTPSTTTPPAHNKSAEEQVFYQEQQSSQTGLAIALNYLKERIIVDNGKEVEYCTLVANAPAEEGVPEELRAQACYQLGSCFEFGEGVEIKEDQAFCYYKLAADMGHVEAQHSVAYCFEHGLGVEENCEEAFRYYELAAKKGIPGAQARLGYFYQNGIGCTESEKEAVKYYSLAAGKSNSDAQNALGYCYEIGFGVVQSTTQASFYYEASAVQGNPLAQYNLGVYYMSLENPEMDNAKEWLGQAANQGMKEAKEILESLKAKESKKIQPKKIRSLDIPLQNSPAKQLKERQSDSTPPVPPGSSNLATSTLGSATPQTEVPQTPKPSIAGRAVGWVNSFFNW